MGSESEESEHESSSPLSRPLFKGIWASAPREEPGTTVRYPLVPWCPPLARSFLNGYELWKYGERPKVCSRRCSNYYSQRILKLKKYFWSFCKKGKVREKFQHVENNFENFKHEWRKINKLQRKC